MDINETAITIVGCGPGSADYLTPVAHKAVAKAQVLVGARRLLELFPESAADHLIVTGHIADVLDEIQRVAKDQSVTVLVSGDPGLFSLSKSVIAQFGHHRCHVIPAVSAVQVAFARTGMSWEQASIISAHHQLPDVQTLNLEDFSKVAILAGHKDIKPWLAKVIKHLTSDINVFVCENLTLKNERVRHVSPDQLHEISFCSRAIILIAKKEML